MNTPGISVILPAYNCEAFIQKAIDSLLSQTFTGFELIIINDGSTDKTESIILSYDDPRIVYQKNPENKGLVFSLNKAIDISRGNYIARMDTDDICLPERLAKQNAFLELNTEVAAIATTIEFINEKDEKTGAWELDRQTITPQQIKKKMLYENCLAHPTMMIRTEVLKKLKYKPYQKNIEDYDLWLRMLNRGFVIGKIEEPLLFYRLHGNSVTNVFLKNKNFFFKHLAMKWKLLWHETFSGYINWYTIQIKFAAFLDLLKGIGKEVKKIFTRQNV